MRAYAAEDRVFRRRLRPLCMDDTRDLAGKLFAHFGVPPILVQRTRTARARRSWYYSEHRGRPARIHMADAASDWEVCHEVAHYVAEVVARRQADEGVPYRDSGHGTRWVAIYVDAVRVAISPVYARRLQLAMGRAGL